MFIPFAWDMETFTYQASPAEILNPERGFRSFVDLLSKKNLSGYRDSGNTLVYASIRLDDYRASDLPEDLLAKMDAAFRLARAAGVKVVLRFAYNAGPYPNSEPDASKEWVLRHIEQLAPILRKNADGIAWMQAGFIGAWGEWHTSTNGLDNPADKREIYNALITALPADRVVQLRTPKDLRALYPNPLTEEQAFTGSAQARTGHHNDCFLAGEDDWGTYPNPLTRSSDKAYLSEMGRFTPVGGETCNPNPPRSDCATALKEMELLHYTELNQNYHPEVIAGWKKGGCFEEMRRRLGYRITLQSASFRTELPSGSVLPLSIRLENSGFAAPVNPRTLYAVLDGPARYVYPLTADPRRWEPGQHEFSDQIRLPVDAPQGTYRLALWLPDPYPTLRDDPRYAIRFANENTWVEETGLNILGQVIVR